MRRAVEITLLLHRRRNKEQRENVVGELLLTEREYARDLKLTWQVRRAWREIVAAFLSHYLHGLDD